MNFVLALALLFQVPTADRTPPKEMTDRHLTDMSVLAAASQCAIQPKKSAWLWYPDTGWVQVPCVVINKVVDKILREDDSKT